MTKPKTIPTETPAELVGTIDAAEAIPYHDPDGVTAVMVSVNPDLTVREEDQPDAELEAFYAERDITGFAVYDTRLKRYASGVHPTPEHAEATAEHLGGEPRFVVTEV